MMGHPSITTHRGGLVRAVCLSSLLLAGGCAKEKYSARSLPAIYQAQPTAINLDANLSLLAAPRVSTSNIEAGDLLEVVVSSGYDQQPDERLQLRVEEDGTIQAPLIGVVPVAGANTAQAEQAIAAAAIRANVYRQPSVTVSIREVRTRRITVVGAVRSPGIKELRRDSSDMLSALAMAGGRTDNASTEVDIVRRPTPAEAGGGVTLAGYAPGAASGMGPPIAPVIEHVDLATIGQPGNNSNLELSEGDVVLVKARPPRVIHVMGLVRRPNQIDIPANQDLRVLDAIALAGGPTTLVADTIHVIRQVPGREDAIVIKVSMMQAKADARSNVLLTAGDIVSIEQTPITVANNLVRQFVRGGVQYFYRPF
jgi:polysaccharide export outer membrane protein